MFTRCARRPADRAWREPLNHAQWGFPRLLVELALSAAGAVEDEVVLVVEVAAPAIFFVRQPNTVALLALRNYGDLLCVHAAAESTLPVIILGRR
jgi:hypothetical protein